MVWSVSFLRTLSRSVTARSDEGLLSAASKKRFTASELTGSTFASFSSSAIASRAAALPFHEVLRNGRRERARLPARLAVRDPSFDHDAYRVGGHDAEEDNHAPGNPAHFGPELHKVYVSHWSASLLCWQTADAHNPCARSYCLRTKSNSLRLKPWTLPPASGSRESDQCGARSSWWAQSSQIGQVFAWPGRPRHEAIVARASRPWKLGHPT